MTLTRTVQELLGTQRWELPPLILHPFSDQSGPSKLLDSSRASLMLNGLMPNDSNEDDLTRRLLEGRLCELRMLYFVGKDVHRWMEHCMDFTNGVRQLDASGIREQSFAEFLVQSPPANVRNKLRAWGVLDYKAIFSRAVGLFTIFAQPPAEEIVSPEFIRNYYRYADHLFACRQQIQPFTEIGDSNFSFEIYASGEYSRMLEKSWESDGGFVS